MNSKRILAAAALGGALFLGTAMAAEPSPGPASATDDAAQAQAQTDSSVAAAVHDKLAAENSRALNDIRVSADGNGVVSLSGRVYAQDVADRAVSLAKSTDGVSAVKNNITVAPESRGGG